jgi:NAD(P) transhydrogenase
LIVPEVNDYDLVVIGSGPAGQKAAISAAKLGKRVAVVERTFSVGGACLHKGTIPSKTLREAVSYLSGVRQRDLYGAAYRVKEKITIEDLSFRTQRVIEREVNTIRDQLLRNYVDIVGGLGCFIDPAKVLVKSEEGTRILTADKFILAVGTRPSRPADIEFDDRRVVDSDGLLKLPEIPRSMTFVGAGIVGCEYATIFRTMGVRVTLIDGRQRPLEFVDDEIEDALYYHMRDEGISLRFGEKVSAVRMPDGERVHVTMESGKELSTDSLMFAAGREGASKSLNLEGIGLATDSRGRIKVNEHFQTSIPHIYAVGDIIGFPSLASTSMEQGRIAAMCAFGVNATTMPERLPFGI